MSAGPQNERGQGNKEPEVQQEGTHSKTPNAGKALFFSSRDRGLSRESFKGSSLVSYRV
jgi:hypothetical protein